MLWCLYGRVLHGKALGKAIDQAIRLKIDAGKTKSRSEVARDFGVSPQAIRGWVNTGSIAKEKLPQLWKYFSDVVGPSHWGLSEADALFIQSNIGQNAQPIVAGSSNGWPFSLTKHEDVVKLTPHQLHQLDLMIAAYLLGVQSNAPKSTESEDSAA